MIERGIGYWITPEGQFVPVPPRVSHADMVRGLIDPGTLSDDQQDRLIVDANAFAIAQGWTRVRIYPADGVAYADLGQGRGPRHRKLLDDLLQQIDLPGCRVKYTDESGGYVSSPRSS